MYLKQKGVSIESINAAIRLKLRADRKAGGIIPDIVEAEKFNIMLARATWYFSSMHFQMQAQSLSSEEWLESKVLIDTYCSHPGYRKYWEVNSYRFSTSFVEYIDERMTGSDV